MTLRHAHMHFFPPSCDIFASVGLRRTLLGVCLQDSLASPVPSELADSYFLEEWARLQERWAELDHQRRTFERERQSFTDAAIRLSHEV